MWRKTMIGIDEPVAEAYVEPGILWNGWEVPHFPRNSAEKVIEWVKSSDDIVEAGMYFLWDGDVLIVTDASQYSGRDDDPENIWVERIAPYVVNGEQTWCIGGYSWTWADFNDDIGPLATLHVEIYNQVYKYMRPEGGFTWERISDKITAQNKAQELADYVVDKLL